jgi:UDP-N-acetylmuramate dehydrogenase
MKTAIEALAGRLGRLAQRDADIGAQTTYRVGGRAALFCELEDEEAATALRDALVEIRAEASGEGPPGSELPILVLGKGSNMLVADAGWPGLCVRLGEGFAGIEIDGTVVTAGGAMAYPVLARRTAAAGLTGMEWAVGIPGSVGGAVRMNAGGHGAETRDRLVSARLLRLGRGKEEEVAAAALELSYRHSNLDPTDLVLSAKYRLEEGPAEEGAARISEVVRWRRDNQPGGQNAGSVFTNPPGDSAGRLIDAAGLKGFRLGTAAVSDKHANFIQADAGGSADDVRRLVAHVRRVVADKTGVELEVELRMVGWDRPLESHDPSCS